MLHAFRNWRTRWRGLDLLTAGILVGCAVPAPQPLPDIVSAPTVRIVPPQNPVAAPTQAPTQAPEKAQKPAPPALTAARPPPPAKFAAPRVSPSTKPQPVPATKDSSEASTAQSERDYRRAAAAHLYGQNAHRIYAGKLPPLLYAIGVLQVDVDAMGEITQINWMRAPTHAPEVVAEIEDTIRRAAPFPRPLVLGSVTYTETWLWHKSGRFQLDTLTKGQL